MSSAIERLGELEARVEAAKQREQGVGVERGRARREAGRAASCLRVYEESVGAGEREPDDEEARRLRDAIRDADEAATEDAWGARFAGARRAVEEAERERDHFGRAHFAEMAAEEAAYDEPVRDELQAAYERLSAAESAYAGRVRRWVRIARYGGLSADHVPGLPTRGTLDQIRNRFAEGIEPPTPRPLREPLDDADDDVLIEA